MKRSLLLFFITILCVSFTACKKKGVVFFCEGLDQEGKGVKCGTVFSTGDLTAVFNSKSSFDTDTLAVKIFNKNDGSRKSIFESSAKVNPDDETGHIELEMYDEGNFHITVEKRGEIISEGDIEIVEAPTK
jgi:hypothetical protein